MFKHLINYINVSAGCIICILELDHECQFLILRYSDYLLSCIGCGSYRCRLAVKKRIVYKARVGYLAYKIAIIIHEGALLLDIGIKSVVLSLEGSLNLIHCLIIHRTVSQDKAKLGRLS